MLDWALQVDWLSPLFLYGLGPGWVNEEGTEQAARDSSDCYLNPRALSETCFVQRSGWCGTGSPLRSQEPHGVSEHLMSPRLGSYC